MTLRPSLSGGLPHKLLNEGTGNGVDESQRRIKDLNEGEGR